MKKLITALTALAVLAIGGVAYAVNLEPTNQYTVGGGVKPSKGDGSAENPKPVSFDFKFTVAEDTSGDMPAPVEKFNILFGGIRVNTDIIPGCTAAKINLDGREGCGKALVGRGDLKAALAPSEPNTDDDGDGEVDEEGELPKKPAGECVSTIEIYNSRKNKAAIFITAEAPAGTQAPLFACPAPGAIDAKFVKSKAGTSLNFVVPDELLHPNGPNSTASVNLTQSNIRKITRKVKGKTRGFFESIGGCSKAGKRNLTVKFTPETGTSQTAQSRLNCTR